MIILFASFAFYIHLSSLRFLYNFMIFGKQISPWTIYDKSPANEPEIQSTFKERHQVSRSLHPSVTNNKVKKQQSPDKYSKLNEKLCEISKEHIKIDENLNILAIMKMIRCQLYEQSNQLTKIQVQLPKINSCQIEEEVKNKVKIKYYSQKIYLLDGFDSQSLEDYQKVFCSQNLQKKEDKEVKQFPKKIYKDKRHRTYLPDLKSNLKQFSDNSIRQVFEMAKQSNYNKKQKQPL